MSVAFGAPIPRPKQQQREQDQYTMSHPVHNNYLIISGQEYVNIIKAKNDKEVVTKIGAETD